MKFGIGLGILHSQSAILAEELLDRIQIDLTLLAQFFITVVVDPSVVGAEILASIAIHKY